MAGPTEVYVEAGDKRAFAGAIEWPGWCRTGRREDDALDGLLAYGTRYANVLAGSVRGFKVPRSRADLTVVERVAGDATTDFGAPSVAPAADARPLDARDLKRLIAILDASWAAFDAIAAAAIGPGAAQGAAWRRARARRHRRSRDRSGDRIRGEAGRASSHDGGTGSVGRRHGGASGRPRRAVPRGRARDFRRKGRAAARSGCRATSFAAPRGTCSITRGRSRIARSTANGARRIPA